MGTEIFFNPYLIGFMATKIGGKLFPTKEDKSYRRNQIDESSEFTKAEVDFIINKLRNSTYKGTEFEQNTFFVEDPNGNVLELKTFEQ